MSVKYQGFAKSYMSIYFDITCCRELCAFFGCGRVPLEWVAGFFYMHQDFNNFNSLAKPFGTIIYDSEVGSTNVAGFGQATYRLFDKRLGLTAGIRYEQSEREMGRDDILITNFRGSKEDEIWLPRFALDYRFAADVMVCASVAKGWRNGGLNVYVSTENTMEYDKTREHLAKHYLRTSSLSGAEISFLLGFEEPNSFFRAFHVWTGKTPEQARKSFQRAC